MDTKNLNHVKKALFNLSDGDTGPFTKEYIAKRSFRAVCALETEVMVLEQQVSELKSKLQDANNEK